MFVLFQVLLIFLGDRGFTCDDILARFKARLVIPDFLPSGTKQLTDIQVIRTQLIARARMPVERFNQRMKTFEFVGDQAGPVHHSKLCNSLPPFN